MKLKARYIKLSGVFLISCLVSYGNSDTLSLVRKADSLFLQADYYKAGNYYQKASFYSFSPENRINLLLKKIDCLKQLSQFSQAEELISATPSNELSDSLLSRLIGQGALCAYLSGDYKKAESYLIALDYKVEDAGLRNNYSVLYALVLNEQARWDEAKVKLTTALSANSMTDSLTRKNALQKVDSMYSRKNQPVLKNPKKARRMSQIIPGLGQCYAGYPLEGAGSLTMNLFVLAGSAVGIYYQYYFTSVMVGNFLFGKFYTGNVARAEFLVEKRNYFLKKKYNGDLKNRILELTK